MPMLKSWTSPSTSFKNQNMLDDLFRSTGQRQAADCGHWKWLIKGAGISHCPHLQSLKLQLDERAGAVELWLCRERQACHTPLLVEPQLCTRNVNVPLRVCFSTHGCYFVHSQSTNAPLRKWFSTCWYCFFSAHIICMCGTN